MNRSVRVVAIVGVCVGVVALGIVTARGAKEADAMLDVLGPAPDSVEGSALWGRYRAQREAAFAMRAYMLRLVALDSTASDSMYSLRFRERVDQLRPDPGMMGPYFYLTRNGWWAMLQHMHSTITCAVAVGPDTSIRGAPSGTPVCYGPPK